MSPKKIGMGMSLKGWLFCVHQFDDGKIANNPDFTTKSQSKIRDLAKSVFSMCCKYEGKMGRFNDMANKHELLSFMQNVYDKNVEPYLKELENFEW